MSEAKEEVGLDINQVHVIGCLPPLALLDTGFIVHPVLAWSERPTSSGSVNYAEVAACLEAPLRQLADRHRHTPPEGDAERGPAEPQQLGIVTSAVIDMLLARMLSDEPTSRAPGQVNNHPMTVDADPSAPWDTFDMSTLTPPQSSARGASNQDFGPP